jgi:hypothetical protein
MRKPIRSFAILVLVWAAQCIAPAQAQLWQSWVASYGDDGNNCSRASPCRTFKGAFGRTNVGGEINCVDQGDFSDGTTLHINKPITIDCEAVQGRFGTAPGALIAIVVAGNPPDVFVLRGLDVFGASDTIAGIVFNSGAALHVEKCVVHDVAGNNGWGFFSQLNNSPANAISEIFISDTVLMNNGTAASGGGIYLNPQPSNGVTRVILNRVEVRNNFYGIIANGNGPVGGVLNMTVRDSVSSGNQSYGILAVSNPNGPAVVMTVDRSTSSHNATAGVGVIADGPKTFIALTRSTVSGNLNGIGFSNGGSLISYQNNDVSLNSVDGNPSSVVALK